MRIFYCESFKAFIVPISNTVMVKTCFLHRTYTPADSDVPSPV
jgi:hypothetical protein